MWHTDVFNSLSTLSEANKVLKERLDALGSRADLAELRDIFEQHQVTEDVGSPYFTSTSPLPKESASSNSDTSRPHGQSLWMLEPYEFGFNHPGQEEYDPVEMPTGFVTKLHSFLAETNLLDVLGICTIGQAESVGRIEKNRGRVNFTVPAVSPQDLDAATNPSHSPSVWSFDSVPAVEIAVNRRPEDAGSAPDATNDRSVTVTPEPGTATVKAAATTTMFGANARARVPAAEKNTPAAERVRSLAAMSSFPVLVGQEVANGKRIR
ncbi:hypothetical protein AK830_g10292 [Neonectria ditissima]|uniref:Uncharacterized protein n=1 Tax=Neonectria ditissima TaxID=78410 RepID=A0A0P7AG33_9HYPO|nr:hypothetical protein AK830_g10292 [Neonectria ditissima]